MVSLCFKSLNKKTIVNLSAQLDKSNFTNLIYTQKDFSRYCNLIIHYTGNNPDTFYAYITKLFSTFIIKNYEHKIIKSQLQQDFFYFSDSELAAIYDMTKQSVTNQKFKAKKLNTLYSELLPHIKKNTRIYIEGFINFRIYKYRALLNTCVESSVHKYVINQEYIEYVNLLKNYIREKTSQTSLVYLIYTPKEKAIIDKDLNIITTTSEKKYISDISFSENDFILNSILSVMPEKLVIHCNNEHDNFIQFLLSIFDSRSELHTTTNLDLNSFKEKQRLP